MATKRKPFNAHMLWVIVQTGTKTIKFDTVYTTEGLAEAGIIQIRKNYGKNHDLGPLSTARLYDVAFNR